MCTINLNSINTYPKIVFSDKNNIQRVGFGINTEPEILIDTFVSTKSNKILNQTCPLEDVKSLLLKTMELKYPILKKHCLAASIYAKALAKEANCSEKQSDEIEIGGLFHDVGKIKNLDGFFEGKRDETNLKVNAGHPIKSYEILQQISPFKGDISNIALCHHERWNGTGFPRYLKGENIPIGARIVSIADSFDSMTRKKYPNQKSVTVEEALEKLKRNKKGKWDPELVDKFIQIVRKDNYNLCKQVITSTYLNFNKN